MNAQLPLTDDTIRAGIARRVASVDGGGLRERVLAAVAAAPQRRGWAARVDQLLVLSQRRAMVAVVLALGLLLAAGAIFALVGSYRPSPAPGALAYISGGDLYVAGPAGESPRLVWDMPATEDLAPTQLVWVDRETVLLETFGGGDGTYLVTIADGTHRRIDRPALVALSPDHRTVAIAAFDQGAAQPDHVRLLDLATGAQVGDIPGLIGGYPAMWSPDGRFIVAESPETIYRVDVSTGLRTVLASGLCCGLSPHWPTWMPDGTRIVYVDYHPGSPGDCEFRCGTLWVASVAGGEPTRLTPERGSEVHPTVSPDGRWITYLDESTSDLVVIAAHGSSRSVLIPGGLSVPVGGGLPDLSWDADSSGLAYLSRGGVLWHLTLDGVASRIDVPMISEFARQGLP